MDDQSSRTHFDLDIGNDLASHGTTRKTREQPRPGGFRVNFALLTLGSSYNSRTTYGVDTPMQKIKFFRGWVRESDAVLQYIDPTTPSPGGWQLLSLMTHGGARAIVTRKSSIDGLSESQHS
jgi:hypothetical protein